MRRQELDEIVELLGARRVVGAIEQRRILRFQRFGGGDIGEDHEFFDQPMRFEPLRPAHVGRAAPAASSMSLRSGRSRSSGSRRSRSIFDHAHRPPRAASARFPAAAPSSRPALPSMARLRLLVGELGGRAHHDAVEACAALAPVGAEDHAHGERRPVFARAQRAEVVGDALGQHRHDAVGEIDRIAALERLAVERRAGPDE